MLTKNEVKDIQSLYQKKYRDSDKLFIAEGPKLSEELLKRKELIKRVYATESWLKKNDVQNISVVEVSDSELSRISNLHTPNEVLIIAKQKEVIEEPFLQGQIIIVLDGIQDPGNVGTIFRIADWFGVQQIICTPDTADIYNPKVVQSSMGSVIRIQSWYKEVNEMKLNSIPVYGAVLNGKNIYSYPKPSEGFLIIGNESKGIRDSLLHAVTNKVTIPKIGNAESLNAAVATGIILGWFANSNI